MPLHWQILVGLFAGGSVGHPVGFFWLEPVHHELDYAVRRYFPNLLKLIAVPLFIGSLTTGVALLAGMKKLSRIGGKIITLYLVTTAIAVGIGLVVVNVLQPGQSLTPELRDRLKAAYASVAQSGLTAAETTKGRGPLQILVDSVPDTVVRSAGNNRDRLERVFFSVLFGIALKDPSRQSQAAS